MQLRTFRASIPLVVARGERGIWRLSWTVPVSLGDRYIYLHVAPPESLSERVQYDYELTWR